MPGEGRHSGDQREAERQDCSRRARGKLWAAAGQSGTSVPREKPSSYVASRWEVWSWEGGICLERRERGEGGSFREKLTIPRRLRLETGWMIASGAEM